MGLSPFRSSSIYDDYSEKSRYPVSPNPDPYKYTILNSEDCNGMWLVEVLYPGVTTYEGRKLLLFGRGVMLDDIWRQRALDPHFSDSKDAIHPVARFRPDKIGRALARAASRLEY